MADPYFSELKYLGGPTLDFIEVTVDAGTDVSGLVITIYNAGGSIRTTNTLAGITPTTVAGKDIYVIDTTSSATFNGLGKTNGISLSEGSTVYQFSSFTDNAAAITATAGPAAGQTSTEIGQAGAGDSLVSEDDGGSYSVNTDPTPGSVPCLTAGSLVTTSDGLIPVEELTPGQLIETHKGTSRPLLHVIRRCFDARALRRNPKLVPVRITAGALGPGLPKRDLLVSRQHRMLVASPIARRMFNTPEVLIAAIKLTAFPGIYVDNTITSVTYFHLVFSQHEVIFAEGAPTESLLLGQEALTSLPAASVAEMKLLFPELVNRSAQRTRHHIPQGRRQAKLVARHAQNRQFLLSAHKRSLGVR
ncbi:Hint domain-containing protein [Aliiroseovarius sp. 2305UL8-7]|uniref:Hint domain-containing protein n=1 Tax=Aliiroseovarius conchicola TaxID=3121637 RepID=UPI003528740F